MKWYNSVCDPKDPCGCVVCGFSPKHPVSAFIRGGLCRPCDLCELISSLTLGLLCCSCCQGRVMKWLPGRGGYSCLTSYSPSTLFLHHFLICSNISAVSCWAVIFFLKWKALKVWVVYLQRDTSHVRICMHYIWGVKNRDILLLNGYKITVASNLLHQSNSSSSWKTQMYQCNIYV